jgi:peptide/nickel transport system substrate-binding protein
MRPAAFGVLLLLMLTAVTQSPLDEAALKKADALLADKGQPPLERVRAAEEALAAALRSGASAGDQRRALEGRLRDVRRQRLQLLTDAAHSVEEWGQALALADELAALYPEESNVRNAVAASRARFVADRIKTGDYPAAREYLERLAPSSLKQAQALEETLKKKAEELRKEAHALKDREAVVARLRDALRAWPPLDGLRNELLRLEGEYAILYVGVRSLPEFLSPATAWTDPERQAVELLFERLLRESYDEGLGERYRPELAAGPPTVIPGGRRFRLRPGARWSDGRRVTALDVRHTAQLLARADLPWRTPEWADLLEPPTAPDPLRIEFHFRLDYLDPRGSLSFPVLPESLERADDEKYGRAPLGSGPFKFAGRRREDGRDCAVFVAVHPAPQIREIRFVAVADPAKEVADPKRPLHLLLGLPTEALAPLRQAGVKDLRTLEDRRVYFLAVNHRLPELANVNVRRALALGIDREAILTAHFRGGHAGRQALGALGAALALAASDVPDGHRDFHRALNGPYPPKSWACAPASRVPAELYDPELARSLLKAAREKEGVKEVKLTLKYPQDEPGVAAACREIARQLAALGEAAGCPIQLQVEAVPPRELRRALQERTYALAYHHLDYGDETYWLWPLFDDQPAALRPGGSNYLGYQDADLAGLFRNAMAHRDFARVRTITHNIHAHLHERMPLIPLWQLDTHLAVHADLTPVGIDPLRIFGDVACWRLKMH